MGNQACPCKASLSLRQQLDGASSSSTSVPAWSLSALNTLGFNALELNSLDLGQVAHHLMLGPFVESHGQSVQDLDMFINRVKRAYLPNLFHGFHHAVDVLQMAKMLGHLMPCELLLSQPERLALAIAAIGHDVGHPGYSNVFLVEACDELALRYNDTLPLENMHCSCLFEILRTKGANVLAHFPKQDARYLRRVIIDAILSTDVENHGLLTAALVELYMANEALFAKSSGELGLSKEQVAMLSLESNKFLVVHGLLHLADISYFARPWEVSYDWSIRAREELFRQGDQEKAMGLQVLPLHNRSRVSIPEAQLGLIHSVAAPLVSAEVRLFKGWQELAASLAANVQEWVSKVGSDAARQDQAERCSQSISAVLDSALQTRCSRHSGKRFTAERWLQEPCSEPSVNNSDACDHEKLPTQPALVREVRRWQEERTDGQNRELVLLYVASADPPNGGSRRGQRILFRFSLADDPPEPPEPPAQPELDSSMADFSALTPALQSVDSGCTRVEGGGFDRLLMDFLTRTSHHLPSTSASVGPPEPVPVPKSPRHFSGIRTWVTALGQTIMCKDNYLEPPPPAPAPMCYSEGHRHSEWNSGTV